MNKHHHNQRAQIADSICPDNGIRGKMLRMGVQPKDHMRENVRELRATQDRAREMREEATRPPKELFKLSQFKDVSSRVYDASQDENIDRQSDQFLAKGNSDQRREEIAARNRVQRQELELKLEEARSYAEKPPSPRKSQVPRSNDVTNLAPRNNTDFIIRNRVKAQASLPQQKRDDEEPSRHSEFGRVPEYLEARKAQWENEKEEVRRRAPDPSCPAGMKLMSEDERTSTLAILEQNRDEAVRQLGKLPFTIETPSQIRRKSELDSKLKEIENAICLFSRPKVYIKL